MSAQTPLAVAVCTTKPEENQAEYAIRVVGTGETVRHGVLLPVPIESLTAEEQQILAEARAIILRLANEHAISQGFIPAP